MITNFKNILVVGGDGFCGWPLSLRLSSIGHNVIVVDNLSRRKIDIELGCESLTPISSIYDRIQAWKEVSDKIIHFHLLNVATEYDKFVQLLKEHEIDTVIHLGEQRAAPYSMKTRNTSRYTVDNNLSGTHNILSAIVEVDTSIHLIHIGTMGVYGYGVVEKSILPEGYVDVKMNDGSGNFKDVNILHPFYPGSIYHLTKTQDALFFQFYAKNWNIKITDLHQGIIWGLHTKETILDPRLINRFDYDSDYGTVLNRFIMQAASNIPLTIYGSGEQTRAFIHIENSMDCIVLAVNNPGTIPNKVTIFNQMVETQNLLTLSKIIQDKFENVSIQNIDNPRKELKSNDLNVCNKKFLDLGLNPIYINSDRIQEIYDYIQKYNSNVKNNVILPSSKW
jgi:UDP-sulfoquinovose synthase